MTQTPLRLALLIDGDNASPASIPNILTRIAKWGIPIAKRVYGDWSLPSMVRWGNVMREHTLKPVQQTAYTSGKNAIDIAMVIDAMDLLATGRLDGFCLVSSDSDFTPLAVRLRKQGIKVYGFGEMKTPQAFQDACDVFTVMGKPAAPVSASPRKPLQEAEALLIATLNRIAPDHAWQQLGPFGHALCKDSPGFKCATYGFATLSKLIRASSRLEFMASDKAPPHGKVRMKKTA